MGIDGPLGALMSEAALAAFDAGLWGDWAIRAGELLEGHSTSFYVVDRSRQAICHQTIHHPDARAVERYIGEEIGRLDPQIGYVSRLAGSAVYRDTDHLDLDDAATVEYLNWQRSNGNLRHYMSTAAILGGGSHVGGLSVHRAVADGPTPDGILRAMRALSPALQDALNLGFVHAEKLSAPYWDGLLTRRTEPAMLLDERGRALRTMPALEAFFAAADGLDCRGGWLGACDPACDARLTAMLRRATARAEPASGAVAISRPSGRAPYVVTAFPLARGVRMLAPFEAAALVTVVDPCDRGTPHRELWRSGFGLSAREAEFASLLMQGHSIESAAAAMRIAGGTARIHLRKLLQRTGTSRQAELIRLLARF